MKTTAALKALILIGAILTGPAAANEPAAQTGSGATWSCEPPQRATPCSAPRDAYGKWLRPREGAEIRERCAHATTTEQRRHCAFEPIVRRVASRCARWIQTRMYPTSKTRPFDHKMFVLSTQIRAARWRVRPGRNPHGVTMQLKSMWGKVWWYECRAEFDARTVESARYQWRAIKRGYAAPWRAVPRLKTKERLRTANLGKPKAGTALSEPATQATTSEGTHENEDPNSRQ